MGAAAPSSSPDTGSFPPRCRYIRPPKPSPRANEVGITSQEAVEYAISYAKQQRQRQEAQQGGQQQQAGREHQLSGPEGEKHYHAFTKSQSGQLVTGKNATLASISFLARLSRAACGFVDSPFADLEAVADSWSKRSFSGIRALPEILEPGFRQQALYETVVKGMLASYSLSKLQSLLQKLMHTKPTLLCSVSVLHKDKTASTAYRQTGAPAQSSASKHAPDSQLPCFLRQSQLACKSLHAQHHHAA